MTARQRLLLMLPVLLVAAGLAVFGDKTPRGSGDVVAPVQDSAGETGETGHGENANGIKTDAGIEANGLVLRVQPRDGLTSLVGQASVDVFASQSPADSEPSSAAGTGGRVEAPAQIFTAIGRMRDEGEWLGFLEHENRTFVVRKGAHVEGFRVEAIESESIVLSNLASKKRYVVMMNDTGNESDNGK
jgi:hypothetical protein